VAVVPTKAPAKAPAPADMDAGVRWTGLLEVALSVLVERNGERVSLEGLVQEMRLSTADPRMKVLLARQLQEAARANVLQIIKDSASMPYYSLTREGRMWAHGRLASEKLRRLTGRRDA
jgi:hypothetical protein